MAVKAIIIPKKTPEQILEDALPNEFLVVTIDKNFKPKTEKNGKNSK